MHTTPLSQNLNNFINSWFESMPPLMFKFVDKNSNDFVNDAKGTLKKMVEIWKNTGTIQICTAYSEETIFGDASINHKFRAWHDFYHITKELSFDEQGEKQVCEHQKNDLPKSYIFERILLDIEINGQIEYLKANGNFVNNQIEFCNVYLKSGLIEALKVK